MPFIELQTVDSTNNYAFSRIHAGLAQSGMAIFAHEQTAGKGQRGKNWSTNRGLNIALTIVLKPVPLAVGEQFQLSVCIALAARELLDRYVGDEAKIKWPNDLYWKDRKAGGILIESIIRSPESGLASWEWAVLGIGLNVNQESFAASLPNPVSLKQITGKTFDSVVLAKELCELFSFYFDKLIHAGFEHLLAIYVSHLYKRDQKVKLKKDNRVFEATIASVSSSGKLIIRHGIEEELDFGSIEWVL